MLITVQAPEEKIDFRCVTRLRPLRAIATSVCTLLLVVPITFRVFVETKILTFVSFRASQVFFSKQEYAFTYKKILIHHFIVNFHA